MRAGIRNQILASVTELKDCYEPNVPRIETPKPYAVAVQGADDPRQDPTSFQRRIEVWLYNDIDTFKKLDELSKEVIDSLNFKTFTDPDTDLSYTAKFNGTIGQDLVDEEWGAIVRGLNFSVIALHETKASNDLWEKATAEFISLVTSKKAYQGTWKEDFQVPSVLCRTISKGTEGINYMAYRENRDIRIHVVSDEREEVNELLDQIEYSLMKAIKIPLDIDDKRYLTISSIRENRDSDMLGTGQITVSMTRISKIERDFGYIEKIYGRPKGGLGHDQGKEN